MQDLSTLWEISSGIFKQHGVFALLFFAALYGGWEIYKKMQKDKRWRSSLEAAVFGGGAYFQKDAKSGVITLASPALAALLGNKMSAKEIVGRTIGQVFEREVVESMLDLDDRLARNDEVLDCNVIVNGNPCTVAKRRTVQGDYWFVQVHIHRQDLGYMKNA